MKKFLAHMVNGWKVEIDEHLYNRIKAGLEKYPNGGATIANPHLLKDGSIIIGKYLTGIEVVANEPLDETREFVDEMPGEVQESPPGTDYGQEIITLSELNRIFQESKLSNKEFAGKLGTNATYLKRVLDGGSPVTAKLTEKVDEFTAVEKNG